MTVPTCLCGSKRFEVFIEGDYSSITSKGKGIKFQALKCKECQMLVTNPPPHTDLNSSENSFCLNKENSQSTVDEYKINYANYRISNLKPYLSSFTNSLKIGCGDGDLVERVAEMGIKESIALEISKKKVVLGKSLGRNIRNMYLHECNFSPNYFDLVQADNVIEHIPNLHNVLSEVFMVLKPKGIFYVTVPRYNSIFVKSSNWIGWFPQQHFWDFTEKTLSNLLADHGFELIDLSCIRNNNYQTNNLHFQKYILYPAKKVFRYTVKKLNLGDTIDAMFIKR